MTDKRFKVWRSHDGRWYWPFLADAMHTLVYWRVGPWYVGIHVSPERAQKVRDRIAAKMLTGDWKA